MSLSSVVGDFAPISVAIYAAGLSTFLALKSIRHAKPKLGVDVDRHFRVAGPNGEWRWLAISVTIRNGSERPTSVVGHSLYLISSEKSLVTGAPVEIGRNERGDPTLIDPDDHTSGVSLYADIVPLKLPINLGPRSAVSGWIAFVFDNPPSSEDLDAGPALLFFIDQDLKYWPLELDGFGVSTPYLPHVRFVQGKALVQ